MTKPMAEHPVEEANERSIFGELTPEDFYKKHTINYTHAHMKNARGFNIFTQSWQPTAPDPLKGIVCVVHGYTGESGWLVQLTAVAMAKKGFAVYALDHQGHGHSDGIPNYIPDINPVVDDCIQFFDSARARHSPSLPAFLYAESLGGAIALLIHMRQPSVWSGAVLNGAMCGISAKFKPPWPLEHLLSAVAWLAPSMPVPTRGNIPQRSFKVEWKKRLALASPRRRVAPPRAATARELVRVCDELQGRFADVTMPLLIIHGAEDVICDPAFARKLYDEAGSSDKTIHVYEGMWHQLVGEPPENVQRVFSDVFDWLLQRAHALSDSII
eukprot:TRINITY_DN7394_c0_g2_i1.p1 TRINITY_DN7394_c0_g2~~TRINITY_DN7394_c0_g2_i1.p1  ORF type:complete len:328 (-),score=-26.38 TRINITY_DN7394_c0_g2_i1:57-1040(-)